MLQEKLRLLKSEWIRLKNIFQGYQQKWGYFEVKNYLVRMHV